MKVLYIGLKVEGKPQTGGEYGQLRNRQMLTSLFKDTTILELPKVGGLSNLKNVLLGKSYGHTSSFKKKLESSLDEGYNIVFMDGSACGEYVKFFNKRNVRTIVFCHNVEYEYYKAKFDSERSLRNRMLVSYFFRQEKLSIQYATKVIALNQRDSDGIKKLYGRNVELILPVFYNKIDFNELQPTHPNAKYLLFVGADFFANTDGMIWFIEKVSKKINIDIYVAGGCCNTISKRLDISKYPNVKLKGFVDDLEELYKNASGVVCPIFAGSGMKTKTIEALKYGKNVFGTPEAFEGICADYKIIGGLCRTDVDFIDTINSSELSLFNENSYRCFIDKYSTDAVYPIFYSFVCDAAK